MRQKEAELRAQMNGTTEITEVVEVQVDADPPHSPHRPRPHPTALTPTVRPSPLARTITSVHAGARHSASSVNTWPGAAEPFRRQGDIYALWRANGHR